MVFIRYLPSHYFYLDTNISLLNFAESRWSLLDIYPLTHFLDLHNLHSLLLKCIQFFFDSKTHHSFWNFLESGWSMLRFEIHERLLLQLEMQLWLSCNCDRDRCNSERDRCNSDQDCCNSDKDCCNSTHLLSKTHTEKQATFNALQRTATYRNIPQRTTRHCNTPQYTGTHCSTLQRIAAYCTGKQKHGFKYGVSCEGEMSTRGHDTIHQIHKSIFNKFPMQKKKSVNLPCASCAPVLGKLYGVPTISRLLKMTGLFCKRTLKKRLYSVKETYNFKEPTNRSHPIAM